MSEPVTKPPGDDFIWPVKGRCDIPFSSKAIPKVESLATCSKKYGPNDWRTWRAEYFEKRLAAKDDPYRQEHSTFADVKRRGCVFNVWTGAEGQLYGMPPDSFRCLAWPGVGVERIGEQCGYGNRDATAAVHVHSPMTNEVITMFRGEGEGFISDHWFPMAEGGDFLYVPPNVPHGMRSGGGVTEYKKGWVGTGFAAPAQWELYTMFKQLAVDETPEAQASGWKQVYKFSNYEGGNYGLLGDPSYLTAYQPGDKGGKP
jgi:mannose-6-phosphate isomerase-like protein (cupin superfamily)